MDSNKQLNKLLGELIQSISRDTVWKLGACFWDHLLLITVNSEGEGDGGSAETCFSDCYRMRFHWERAKNQSSVCERKQLLTPFTVMLPQRIDGFPSDGSSSTKNERKGVQILERSVLLWNYSCVILTFCKEEPIASPHPTPLIYTSL